MKLFDKATCEPTGTRQPYLLNPVEVVEHTAEMSHGNGQYGNQAEYRLEVNVGCTFFANRAQYNGARKNAEQIIAREFFADSLKWISYARRAAIDGNVGSILVALDELEREILG